MTPRPSEGLFLRATRSSSSSSSSDSLLTSRSTWDDSLLLDDEATGASFAGRLAGTCEQRPLRDEHDLRLGAQCQAGAVWLTVLLACSSSTSGPSLLRRVKTSASLVVRAFALDPFALLACLLVDDPGLGAARGVLR